MMKMKVGFNPVTRSSLLLALFTLSACNTVPPSNVKENARLTPATRFTRALTQLPEPRVKIAVAVYGLRDQTGQYKASPDSPYSTEVTQGAATLLVNALRDSGWYMPVEREGLQNLLTERRIVRAIESPTDKGKPVINLPNLMPASLIIEGGIIGYESNVRTGGKGANFLGVGSSTQYHVDQVTAALRSIDIRTGQVLNTVSVTKTIYSYQFSANVYRYVNYQSLLQAETGYTTNEPQQLAVKEALESAVVHLTVAGVHDRYLELKNERDWINPVIQSTLRASQANMSEDDIDDGETIPMQAMSADYQPQMVVPLVSNTDVPVAKPDVPVKPAVEVTAPVPAVSPAAIQSAVPVVQSTKAVQPKKDAKPEKMPVKNPAEPLAKSVSRMPVLSAIPALAVSFAPPEKAVSATVKMPVLQDIKASHRSKSSTTDDIFNSYWDRK